MYVKFTCDYMQYKKGDVVSLPGKEATNLVNRNVASRCIGEEWKDAEKHVSEPPSDKMFRYRGTPFSFSTK